MGACCINVFWEVNALLAVYGRAINTPRAFIICNPLRSVPIIMETSITHLSLRFQLPYPPPFLFAITSSSSTST